MDNVEHKYVEFKSSCLQCKICHDAGLCEPGSRPLFMKKSPKNTDILLVLEAPNDGDTFTPSKGYLTVGPDTDDTGILLHDLFINELCLDVDQYLFITNSVLCLPRSNGKKYPVNDKLRNNCSVWFKMIIDEFQPKIVCTIGHKAFKSAMCIEQHVKNNYNMRDIVSDPINWYGRILFPVFHMSKLGRANRSVDLQREDWRKLRQIYNVVNAA